MAYHPFENIGLKFLAVLIAVLLWFAVAGEQTVERSLRIPLELQNMPEQLELTDVPPANVDVRMRGSSGVLAHLSPGDLVAVVDLTGVRPGRRIFHLSPDQVRAPLGVDVAQVSPSTLVLEFERSAVHTIPVVPTIEGKPADGYVMGKVTVDPPTVRVVGPETAVRELQEAVTEPISIDGATRSVKNLVSIGVQTPSVRLASGRTAVVSIAIDPAPIERDVASVPVRLQNLRATLTGQAVPPVVTITVRGPRTLVDGLSPDALSAYVDLARLGRGRYNLQVHVEPVPSLDVLRISPATVRVTLQ